jgi:hypothetical protein
MGHVPGIIPPRTKQEDHVYVYYPLTVVPERRDDLRRYLLKHGVDTKKTDMSECTNLKFFQDENGQPTEVVAPKEASILEICVYPIIPRKQMVRIARLIRSWAGLPEFLEKEKV